MMDSTQVVFAREIKLQEEEQDDDDPFSRSKVETRLAKQLVEPRVRPEWVDPRVDS